ncbi:glycoside hydrolase family 3 N-terminal domain-containing protein [Dysgonomonas sp. 520]|uniref:glycoside hydrolase family 3 N-terminal domain-containing protein n=1 Tax=Dysgonomonas sp. 520 TaxID=2302931 RepID=UPI0013CF6BF1|nr:glycoside hydrolase family 3 N-terminal domain-containing protein [Dysgonomonas sp. 520]NDW08140.1 glycoside hydrolase [Dysgonomonas sp. 520]
MKRYFASALIIFTSVFGFAQTNKIVPNMEKKADQKKMNAWVDSVFNTMTLDQKIGQMIVVAFNANNSDVNKKKLLSLINNQYVGGIIFRKGTAAGQAGLVNYAQRNSKIPLLVGADAEWGLSMRLENTTRFPWNMMLGAIQEDSLLYLYGKEMARQCKLMGIHVNYAPVMDVNTNPDNPVIGARAFSDNPERVSHHGRLFSKGLEDNGILSSAKHFPGHGSTSADSHHTLPLVDRDLETLNEEDISVFKDYIEAGFGSVMVGHMNIPALDKSGDPSSLSKPIVTDLLQDQLGFSGLIVTDGLEMKGISGEPDMSVRLISAGNDMLLGPIYPVKEFNALKAAVANKTLSEELINEKCKKILRWKYILGANKAATIDTKNLMASLNSPHAEWLNRKLNEKAMTLLKNDGNIIPFKNLDKQKIAVVSVGATKGNSFQRTLNLYDNVVTFEAPGSEALSGLRSSLARYSTVIIAIHGNKGYSDNAIENILKDKKGILVFLSNPYKIGNYPKSVNAADAVLAAYENTRFAQEYAAQALFGGNSINGILPVTVPGLFDMGDGLKTEKGRLSYNIPEEVGVSSQKLGRIENVIREGLKEKAYPGCQVLIAKDGVVIYNKSFGTFTYESKQEVTDDDIYDLASMSKATATVPAVMQLFDQKKIGLNDKLSKYVPVLKNTDKANITVREALLHETGMPSFIPYYMPAIDTDSYNGKLFNARQTPLYSAEFDRTTWARTDYKFKPNLISAVPKKGYDLKIADKLYGNVAYKDTLLDLLANAKLRATKKYLYSCLNFMLLKEAVEEISKEDLSSFLQKNFYEKLGAYTTTYNPLEKFGKNMIVPTEKDDFLRKQLLQGYAHDEGAAFLGGISGNAGLFSNANDLAKLYQMLLNNGEYGGEHYLSKQTCRTFTITKSSTSRRGLGFDKPDIQNTNSSPTSPSTPVSTYGHTGFTGTSFWIDPDNQLIYIFLSNRVYPKRTNRKLMSLNIRSRIQEEIYNALNNPK